MSKKSYLPRAALVALTCITLSSARSHAQETCNICPPGTVAVEVTGPTSFKDCTAAYDYQTSVRYEYLLTIMIQNEALFSPAYQSICERRSPESFSDAHITLATNRARLSAESASIPGTIAELIRTDVSEHVPTECREDKNAQDQSIANTHKWIESIRETYNAQALDYAENAPAGTVECRHLASNKAAYIYEMDLKNDILLGVSAAQAHMKAPQSQEMKDTFVRYKTARNKIDHHQTAATTQAEATP